MKCIASQFYNDKCTYINPTDTEYMMHLIYFYCVITVTM